MFINSLNPYFSSITATKLVLGILALCFVAIIYDYGRMLMMRRKLPPGPFPFPIIGNHLQIPLPKPWIAFEKWSQYYDNPLLTIWLGRNPHIIVNDAWTASEMMDRRADIYSSRPRMVVMGDLIGSTDTNQVCLVYGDQWRLHRKLLHSVMGSHAVRQYRGFQGDESKILTADILNAPNDYVKSIERYAISVASIVGWGRRINQNNDYVAQQALKLMEGVDLIIPGGFWIESLPWLAHLPSWIYPFPHLMREGSSMMKNYFYALSKEASLSNSDNFAKTLMKEQKIHGLRDREVASLTSNIIGGGVDTTSSSIITAILAMCVFQGVQAKAHEEIDRVIGHDRSPTWSDESSLPYMAALVKEVLRWRTVTILAGLPHAPIRDDVFRGYYIPANTTITGNIWAIHRHPREFPEPDVFRPERYIGGSEKPYPTTRGHHAFGFGRRQCSGQPLAEQGLFMALTRLLWAYKLQPGLTEDGQEVKLDIFAYTDSENMRPQPFAARFTPRSEKIHELIKQEAKTAREDLKLYDGETKLTMENAGQFLKSVK